MLEKKKEDRPNSREIILLLTSIQQDKIKTDGFPEMKPYSENKFPIKLTKPNIEEIRPKQEPSTQTVLTDTSFNQNQKQENLHGKYISIVFLLLHV